MNKRLGAFTLIELLLGMLIFSIIGVSLYSMFSGGLKLEEKSKNIHKIYHEARLSFDLLAKELENSCFFDFTGGPAPTEVAFKGEADRVHFLVPTDDGIKSIEYYLGLPQWGKVIKTIIGKHVNKMSELNVSSTEESPIKFLMRREALLVDVLAKDKDKATAEVIASGIKKEGLKFSYGAWKVDSSGAVVKPLALQWESTWNKPKLPAAVAIELILYDQTNPNADIALRREVFLPASEK